MMSVITNVTSATVTGASLCPGLVYLVQIGVQVRAAGWRKAMTGDAGREVTKVREEVDRIEHDLEHRSGSEGT